MGMQKGFGQAKRRYRRFFLGRAGRNAETSSRQAVGDSIIGVSVVPHSRRETQYSGAAVEMPSSRQSKAVTGKL
jgi:hypothetical protein